MCIDQRYVLSYAGIFWIQGIQGIEPTQPTSALEALPVSSWCGWNKELENSQDLAQLFHVGVSLSASLSLFLSLPLNDRCISLYFFICISVSLCLSLPAFCLCLPCHQVFFLLLSSYLYLNFPLCCPDLLTHLHVSQRLLLLVLA